jgi:sporulation protein YhbH
MSKINKELSDIWKLRQRGKRDSDRHKELVKKAIKEHGKHIISDYNIITSDGNKKVKVPIKYLEQYKIKHGSNSSGQGAGHSLNGKPGQKYKIGNKKSQSDGDASNESSEIVFESEVTIDELVNHLIKDLNLPWMEPKQASEIEIENEELSSKEKVGIWPNIDLKKSLIQNLKRHAAEGAPRIGSFKKEDLYYKHWENEKEYESQAAIYLMLDTSGSMSKDRLRLAKNFYFWMVQFIRRRYKKIKIHCIAHNTTASFVSEEEFFRTSDNGGTSCSSAFKLAYDHMSINYNPESWNIYVMEFSDGDNWGEDNNLCVSYIRKMLPKCAMVGYGEVLLDDNVNSWTSRNLLSSIIERDVKEEKVVVVKINNEEEVFESLKKFFKVRP